MEGSAHQTRNDSDLRDNLLVEGDLKETRRSTQVFRSLQKNQLAGQVFPSREVISC